MMLAPKSGYIKVICVESYIFIDVVYGDCSVEKDKYYDVLIEDDTWCLVKFGSGLCPYKREYFKTEAEIRDITLNDIIQ